MKKRALFTCMMLSFSLITLMAENDFTSGDAEYGSKGGGWNASLMNFNLRGTRNGYSFGNDFFLKNQKHRIGLHAAYGNIFGENMNFGQMITGRAGASFGYKDFDVGSSYGRIMPHLGYLYHGNQTGVDGWLSYRFSPELFLKGYVFYGLLSHDGLEKIDNSLYYVISGYGDIYSDFQNNVMYRLDFSQAFELSNKKISYSVDGRVRADLFLNKLTAEATVAYVNRLDSAFSDEYRYDFAAFTPGVPRGIVFGDFAAVLEVTGRWFFLERIPKAGLISNMLYLNAFVDTGYMLPTGNRLKEGLSSVTVGGGVGILFFASDLSFEMGWNSNQNFVWRFTVLTNILKW